MTPLVARRMREDAALVRYGYGGPSEIHRALLRRSYGSLDCEKTPVSDLIAYLVWQQSRVRARPTMFLDSCCTVSVLSQRWLFQQWWVVFVRHEIVRMA